MPNDILDKNPALLRPAQEGAMVSADAMAAPHLAAANVAGAVGGLGERAFGIAQKIQERRNQGQLADLRLEMRQHRAQWERDVMPGLDPEKRLEAWEQASDQFAGSVLDREVAPQVRSAFEQTYKDFRGRSSMEIQASAYAEMDRAAIESQSREAEHLYNDGNVAEANAVIDQMPLPSWKKDSIKADLEKGATYDRYRAQAMEGNLDPEMEKPAGFSPYDWERIMRSNEIGRARTADELIEGLMADESIATEGDLDRELEKIEDFLGPGQAKEAKQNWMSRVPIIGEEWSDWKDRINDLGQQYGKIPEEDYQKAYYELSGELRTHSRRQGQRDLMQVLQAQHPDTRAERIQQGFRSRKDYQEKRISIDYGNKVNAMINSGANPDLAKGIRAVAELELNMLLDQATEEDMAKPGFAESLRKRAWDTAAREVRSSGDTSFSPGTSISPTDVSFGAPPPGTPRYRRGGGDPRMDGSVLPPRD